jgi:hypothetical protein
MKNKGLLILIPVVLILLGGGLYFLLSGPDETVWSDCIDEYGMPKDVNGALASYYHVTVANEVKAPSGCNVYVDYSDGIAHAWELGENKTLLKELVDVCSNLNGAQYFPLHHNAIQSAQTFGTGVEQNIMKPEQYVETMAPIDLALKQIVEGQTQAVLVTDMELYESNSTGSASIKTTPWSEPEMRKWLEKGNRIEVRYAPARFIDKKAPGGAAQKHLYFIFFIPKGISDQQSVFANFMIDGASLSNGFSLNPQPSLVSNEYGGVDKSGLNEAFDSKDGMVKITNACLKEKLRYEFIDHQGFNWDYINQMITEGGASKNDFFRKLYLDLSNKETFSIDEIDVEVYDITEDFTKFSKWNCVKDLKPAMTKDGNQSDVWAESVSPLEREAFQENTLTLKDEYKYVPGKGVKLDEVFEVNNQLFQNGLQQDRKKVEVGINLHPNFNYEKFQEHSEGIIRIDIVVKKQSWNSSNPNLAELAWIGQGGDNFMDAIKNLGTMPSNASCQPTGDNHRILYTYFFKMAPNQ